MKLIKYLIISLLGLAILFFNTTTIFAKTTLNSVEYDVSHASAKTPLVFSHRGSPYNNPDHSFSGYDQAIKDGTQFIEPDVWLSKDNILYVSHDNNLKNSTGKNINISDSTEIQLSKVKLRNGESLHKLSDLFNKYKKTVHYIIEAKKNTGSNTDTEKTIAEELDDYKMNDNVIMQGFSITGIKEFHSQSAQRNIPTLWLMNADTQHQYLEKINDAPKYIDFVSVRLDQLTPEIIKAAHKNGFKINTWTMNNYKDNFSALNIYKVDSVFTNNTKETMNLIKKWK